MANTDPREHPNQAISLEAPPGGICSKQAVDHELEKTMYQDVESAWLEYPTSPDDQISQTPSTLTETKPGPSSSIATEAQVAAPTEEDRCLPIRNICIGGLILTLCFAITTLCTGSYLLSRKAQPPPAWLEGTCAWIGFDYAAWIDPGNDVYLSGRWLFAMSQAATGILPFVASYGITAFLDCTSRIRTTSLRWALYREGRLDFHSNSRLYSSSKTHGPNAWYSNVGGILATTLAYGALSCLFSEVHILGWSDDQDLPIPDKPYYGPQYALDVNGWALTILGLAMLLQSALATWSLLDKPGLIGTWSTHVEATLRVISPKHMPSLSSVSTFGSAGCDEKKTTITVVERASTRGTGDDRTKQASAREIVPSVRHITLVLWILFAVSVLCVIVVSVLAHLLHPYMSSLSNAYVENYTSDGLSVQGYWAGFGQVFFQVATRLTATDNRDWLGVIIQSCFLAPLTLCLHYTETLSDVLGDEMEWREAMSSKPASIGGGRYERLVRTTRERCPDWLVNNYPRWPACALFLLKGLLQWIFSGVLSVGFIAYIALLPLVALSVVLLALAAGAEILSRHHPRGAIRSTYGNLVLCRTYQGRG